MVVVRALVLKLVGYGLSLEDFPIRVPERIPVIERSLNPVRNECWIAKEVDDLTMWLIHFVFLVCLGIRYHTDLPIKT